MSDENLSRNQVSRPHCLTPLGEWKYLSIIRYVLILGKPFI